MTDDLESKRLIQRAYSLVEEANAQSRIGIFKLTSDNIAWRVLEEIPVRDKVYYQVQREEPDGTFSSVDEPTTDSELAHMNAVSRMHRSSRPHRVLEFVLPPDTDLVRSNVTVLVPFVSSRFNHT